MLKLSDFETIYEKRKKLKATIGNHGIYSNIWYFT